MLHWRGRTMSDYSSLDPCVHCGFCLPACPTYLVTGDEGHRPRGRLVLMRALEGGEMEPPMPPCLITWMRAWVVEAASPLVLPAWGTAGDSRPPASSCMPNA